MKKLADVLAMVYVWVMGGSFVLGITLAFIDDHYKFQGTFRVFYTDLLVWIFLPMLVLLFFVGWVVHSVEKVKATGWRWSVLVIKEMLINVGGFIGICLFICLAPVLVPLGYLTEYIQRKMGWGSPYVPILPPVPAPKAIAVHTYGDMDDDDEDDDADSPYPIQTSNGKNRTSESESESGGYAMGCCDEKITLDENGIMSLLRATKTGGAISKQPVPRLSYQSPVVSRIEEGTLLAARSVLIDIHGADSVIREVPPGTREFPCHHCLEPLAAIRLNPGEYRCCPICRRIVDETQLDIHHALLGFRERMRLVFNDLQLFKTQQDDACQTYIDAMTGNGEYPVDDFFKDGVDKNKETLRLLQVVYDHLNNYEWDWTDEKANPIEVALAAVRSAPERCGLVEQWLSFNRWILRRRDELMASRAGLVDIIDFQYRLTYGPYSYICFQPELSKQWVLAKMRFLSALAMDDPPDVPREKGMEMLGKIATNHCLSCGHPDVRLSVSQEDLLDPSVEKLRDKDLVFLEGPEVPKGLLWCGCWGHTFKDWARWAPFQHLKPTGTSLRDCLVACDKCGHRTPFAWMGFDRNNGLVCTACLGDARRWEDDIREFNERQNVK